MYLRGKVKTKHLRNVKVIKRYDQWLCMKQNNFAVIENKTLADLNSKYFTPVGRTIPESHVFKLEHFVIAESKT